MKAIINGVRYDTEKATLIGHTSNNNACSRSDFHYWEAGLYVSPRAKRYFLAGSGGPMSRFSRSAGQNSWTGGSAIQPMTREEALEWAEHELRTEEVEAHFADMIEEA
jgi:hypothetical protein